MANILIVGGATVDIINVVDHYPQEDEKLRAQSQRISAGGNALNTALVLAQAGHHCTWMGTLGDDAYADLIVSTLNKFNIDIKAQQVTNSTTPVSHIIANASSGSRTIIHYRQLAELSLAMLNKLDLHDYDWIHFEGRNIEVLNSFLSVAAVNCRTRISLEAEKNRDGIAQLFALVGLVLFSANFHNSQMNKADSVNFLQAFQQNYAGVIASQTLGSQGACLLDANGQLYVQAVDKIAVVDSVGAGDVYNALIIDGMLAQLDYSDALRNACNLASKKCMQLGFENLFDYE